MKKILITGSSSYIGTSLIKWLSQWQDYYVEELDLLNENWSQKEFQQFDVVYHVAGIAHIKQTEENKDLYYKVNRDLAIDVAKKAKQENVKHFIFLSSMSVYGMEQGIITKDTPPNPNCHYGNSKYEAEKEILSLESNTFKVSILRPPMVYGKACKGNFTKLINGIAKVRVFPIYNNQRSMIYIDNLSEFIRIIIEKEIVGVLYPQNEEFISTYEIIKYLSETKKIFIFFIPGLSLILRKLSLKYKLFSKIFGNLVYDQELSNIGYDYNKFKKKESFQESIGSN